MKKTFLLWVCVVLVWARANTKGGTDESQNHLFRVVQAEKWGYINHSGQIVIRPQYDWALDFSEDLACVQTKKKYGFINSEGAVIIPPQYDFAEQFSEGVARVCIGEQFGYIDKTGKMAITPQFNTCWDFSEGLGLARRKKVGPWDLERGQWNFLNRQGLTVIEGLFDAMPFKEGLAPVCREGSVREGGTRMPDGTWFALPPTNIGKNWHYIDKTGNVVLATEFDAARQFSSGLAAVQIGEKWGYIDKKGNTQIRPQFDEAEEFTDDRAVVGVGNILSRKWGFIDRVGQAVTPMEFDFAGPYRDGLARVQKGGKWLYLDKSGKTVLEVECRIAYDFDHGLAEVRFEGDTMGYIDTKGSYVWRSIIFGSSSPASRPDQATSTVQTTTPPRVATQGKVLPRLVNFGSDAAVPSRMMKPVLEELKREYTGRLSIELYDVRENPGSAQQFAIQIVPTQIFFDAAGKELFRHEGYLSREDILAKWKELKVDLAGTEGSN